MSKNHVKNVILKNIRKAGWFTYPQLLRVLTEEGVLVNGSYQLEMKDKNIVLWGGLSQNLVEALTELFQEGKVMGMPAPIELYQVEGMPFHQPLVLSIPNEPLPTSAVFLTFLRYIPEMNNVTPIKQ